MRAANVLLEAQTTRFEQVDPLLPAAASPPDGDVLTAALPDGERVAGVLARTWIEPGTAPTLWSPLETWELHPLLGATGGAGMSALLREWRRVLSLHPTAADSACLLTWPSRDAEASKPLLAHGFVPLTSIAVRTGGAAAAQPAGLRVAGAPLPSGFRGAAAAQLAGSRGAVAPQPADLPGTAAPPPTGPRDTAAPQPTGPQGAVAPQPPESPGATAPQPADSPGAAAAQLAGSRGAVAPQPPESPGTAAPQPAESPGAAAVQLAVSRGVVAPQPAELPGAAPQPTGPRDTVASQPAGSRGAVAPQPAGLRVRFAGPRDLEVALEFELAELRYSALVGAALDRPGAARIKRAALTRHLEQGDPVWLAERDGIPVGLAHCRVIDVAPGSLSALRLRPGRWGYVNCVSVVEEARGAGVGQALMAAAHHELHRRGTVGTFLYYNPPNPLASVFWARQGYRPLWTSWELRPAGALR